MVIDFPFQGSVSHGTHRVEDLISAFSPVLRALNPKRLTEITANRDSSEDDQADLIVELMDALDLEAPEGYYFGAHEGDGADFGFWPAFD